MIPFFVLEAHGGRVLTIDDPAVTKDQADIDGVGGNDYEPQALVAPFEPGSKQFGRIRRMIQRVPHDGDVTVRLAVVHDGQESVEMERTLESGDPAYAVFPLSETGRAFSLLFTFADWTADCGLADGQLIAVPRQGL